MKAESKIAELGMINMLCQIKNPLTNIQLCLELLESATVNQNKEVYYKIMKNSVGEIESTVRSICNSFQELGITLHVGSDTQEIE